MREKMDGVYFKYKLIDFNQAKWFYIDNQRPQLPKPSMYAPVHGDDWNAEACCRAEEGQLIVERVAFSFMKRHIQPLMKTHHYGYEYTGSDDVSRFTKEEISADAVMERLEKYASRSSCRRYPGVLRREASEANKYP